MVRFWGYSGDVGSVWFLPSGDVKSTYISRVKATSPESNHTPPELKNHSGDVKNRFWLYKEKVRAKHLSSGKTITTIVFGVLVLLVFLAFGAVKVSILHIDNFLSPALL